MMAGFEFIGTHLPALSLEIAVLIAVVAVIERLLGKSSSMFRYLLWAAVLARLAVPVYYPAADMVEWLVGGALEPSVSFERLIELPSAPVTMMPVAAEVMPVGSGAAFPVESPYSRETQAPMVLAAGLFGAAWSMVVCLLMAVVFIRWLRVRRVLRMYREVSRPEIVRSVHHLSALIGLRHVPRAVTGDAGTVSLAGVFRPCIVIPRGMADAWPVEDLEPVILHELAHVKRADLAVNWLQVILQAVYFFHPLVWYVNRRLRRLREEVCDDMALMALNGSRKRYIESMLKIHAEATARPAFGYAAMGFSANRSGIGERIRRIMNTSRIMNVRLSVRAVSGSVMIMAAAIAGSMCLAGVLSAGGAVAAETLSSGQAYFHGGDELRMLLREVENMRTRYTSLSVKCEYMKTKSGGIVENQYGTLFQWTPGKFYHENYDKNFASLTSKAFIHDNTIELIRYAIDDNGQDLAYGTVGYPGMYRSQIEKSFPKIYDMHHRLSDHLQLCATGAVVCTFSTVTYGGEPCYRVEFRGNGNIPKIEGHDWGYTAQFRDGGKIETVWIARAQLVPLKYELYDNAGEVREETIIEYGTFTEYGGGDACRLPVEIRTIEYAAPAVPRAVTTTGFSDWEINRTMDVSMKFPGGMTVTDYLDSSHPRQYVVK